VTWSLSGSTATSSGGGWAGRSRPRCWGCSRWS